MSHDCAYTCTECNEDYGASIETASAELATLRARVAELEAALTPALVAIEGYKLALAEVERERESLHEGLRSLFGRAHARETLLEAAHRTKHEGDVAAFNLSDAELKLERAESWLNEIADVIGTSDEIRREDLAEIVQERFVDAGIYRREAENEAAQSREREAGMRRAAEQAKRVLNFIYEPDAERITIREGWIALAGEALDALRAALAPAPATEGNSSAGLTGSPAPEPFCACGRVGSRCDSSRAGCHGPEKRCRITSKDVRDPTCTRCRTREAQP